MASSAIVALLAIGSTRAARIGISGLVLVVLFVCLGLALIATLSRHRGDATEAGTWGFLILTFLACILGTYLAAGGPALLTLGLVGGLTALAASGPLLELPLPHRLTLAVLLPLLFVLASVVGNVVEKFFLENALK